MFLYRWSLLKFIQILRRLRIFCFRVESLKLGLKRGVQRITNRDSFVVKPLIIEVITTRQDVKTLSVFFARIPQNFFFRVFPFFQFVVLVLDVWVFLNTVYLCQLLFDGFIVLEFFSHFLLHCLLNFQSIRSSIFLNQIHRRWVQILWKSIFQMIMKKVWILNFDIVLVSV